MCPQAPADFLVLFFRMSRILLCPKRIQNSRLPVMPAFNPGASKVRRIVWSPSGTSHARNPISPRSSSALSPSIVRLQPFSYGIIKSAYPSASAWMFPVTIESFCGASSVTEEFCSAVFCASDLSVWISDTSPISVPSSSLPEKFFSGFLRTEFSQTFF